MNKTLVAVPASLALVVGGGLAFHSADAAPAYPGSVKTKVTASGAQHGKKMWAKAIVRNGNTRIGVGYVRFVYGGKSVTVNIKGGRPNVAGWIFKKGKKGTHPVRAYFIPKSGSVYKKSSDTGYVTIK